MCRKTAKTEIPECIVYTNSYTMLIILLEMGFPNVQHASIVFKCLACFYQTRNLYAKCHISFLLESTEELCIEDSKLLHIAAFLRVKRISWQSRKTITTRNLQTWEIWQNSKRKRNHNLLQKNSGVGTECCYCCWMIDSKSYAVVNPLWEK